MSMRECSGTQTFISMRPERLPQQKAMPASSSSSATTPQRQQKTPTKTAKGAPPTKTANHRHRPPDSIAMASSSSPLPLSPQQHLQQQQNHKAVKRVTPGGRTPSPWRAKRDSETMAMAATPHTAAAAAAASTKRMQWSTGRHASAGGGGAAGFLPLDRLQVDTYVTHEQRKDLEAVEAAEVALRGAIAADELAAAKRFNSAAAALCQMHVEGTAARRALAALEVEQRAQLEAYESSRRQPLSHAVCAAAWGRPYLVQVLKRGAILEDDLHRERKLIMAREAEARQALKLTQIDLCWALQQKAAANIQRRNRRAQDFIRKARAYYACFRDAPNGGTAAAVPEGGSDDGNGDGAPSPATDAAGTSGAARNSGGALTQGRRSTVTCAAALDGRPVADSMALIDVPAPAGGPVAAIPRREAAALLAALTAEPAKHTKATVEQRGAAVVAREKLRRLAAQLADERAAEVEAHRHQDLSTTSRLLTPRGVSSLSRTEPHHGHSLSSRRGLFLPSVFRVPPTGACVRIPLPGGGLWTLRLRTERHETGRPHATTHHRQGDLADNNKNKPTPTSSADGSTAADADDSPPPAAAATTTGPSAGPILFDSTPTYHCTIYGAARSVHGGLLSAPQSAAGSPHHASSSARQPPHPHPHPDVAAVEQLTSREGVAKLLDRTQALSGALLDSLVDQQLAAAATVTMHSPRGTDAAAVVRQALAQAVQDVLWAVDELGAGARPPLVAHDAGSNPTDSPISALSETPAGVAGNDRGASTKACPRKAKAARHGPDVLFANRSLLAAMTSTTPPPTTAPAIPEITGGGKGLGLAGLIQAFVAAWTGGRVRLALDGLCGPDPLLLSCLLAVVDACAARAAEDPSQALPLLLAALSLCAEAVTEMAAALEALARDCEQRCVDSGPPTALASAASSSEPASAVEAVVSDVRVLTAIGLWLPAVLLAMATATGSIAASLAAHLAAPQFREVPSRRLQLAEFVSEAVAPTLVTAWLVAAHRTHGLVFHVVLTDGLGALEAVPDGRFRADYPLRLGILTSGPVRARFAHDAVRAEHEAQQAVASARQYDVNTSLSVRWARRHDDHSLFGYSAVHDDNRTPPRAGSPDRQTAPSSHHHEAHPSRATHVLPPHHAVFGAIERALIAALDRDAERTAAISAAVAAREQLSTAVATAALLGAGGPAAAFEAADGATASGVLGDPSSARVCALGAAAEWWWHRADTAPPTEGENDTPSQPAAAAADGAPPPFACLTAAFRTVGIAGSGIGSPRSPRSPVHGTRAAATSPTGGARPAFDSTTNTAAGTTVDPPPAILVTVGGGADRAIQRNLWPVLLHDCAAQTDPADLLVCAATNP